MYYKFNFNIYYKTLILIRLFSQIQNKEIQTAVTQIINFMLKTNYCTTLQEVYINHTYIHGCRFVYEPCSLEMSFLKPHNTVGTASSLVVTNSDHKSTSQPSEE